MSTAGEFGGMIGKTHLFSFCGGDFNGESTITLQPPPERAEKVENMRSVECLFRAVKVGCRVGRVSGISLGDL